MKHRCGYCGNEMLAAELPGPEHSQFCPRYEKPKRRIKTIRGEAREQRERERKRGR